MYSVGDYPDVSFLGPFQNSSLFRFPDERKYKVGSQDACMIQHMLDRMRHRRRIETAVVCLVPVLPKDLIGRIIAAVPRGSLSPTWVKLLERPSTQRLTTKSFDHIMITGHA